MKNSSKLIFFLMMIFSTLMIISSYSWFNAWMGLEINLISFISLILINKKSYTIEASIIYFIMQSFASIMFLMSILIYMMKLYLNFYFLKFSYEMILSTLLMKVGSAPFHFWMPLMMEGLNWMSNYLLMTWQKMGPLILIFNSLNQKFLILFIIFSAITGALGGFNQTSIKKLMSFSSINQISWLLMSLVLGKFLLKIYYFFYFFITFNTLIIFNMFKLYHLNQLYCSKYLDKSIMMYLFFNIFSMGGLPPFLGFFPKMMIIMSLNDNMIMFILILFTLIVLYYYFRLMYFIMFLKFFKKNNYLKKNNNKNMINLNFIMYLSYVVNIFLLIFLLI